MYMPRLETFSVKSGMVLNDSMCMDMSLAINLGCHSSANTLDKVYPLRFNSRVWEARCCPTMATLHSVCHCRMNDATPN